MIIRNRSSGMSGGMCHSHASDTEPATSCKNNRKWHVVMLNFYYYIYMNQKAIFDRIFGCFKYCRLTRSLKI